MSNNPFWDIVIELYPTFLNLILLYGTWRLVKGVFEKIQGKEEGISNAISDIIIAFFWAHMSIPLVLGIFSFMEHLSNTLEPTLRTISGG
ncbi:MAG: hypothetical protein ACOCRK_09375 [bacterium]